MRWMNDWLTTTPHWHWASPSFQPIQWVWVQFEVGRSQKDATQNFAQGASKKSFPSLFYSLNEFSFGLVPCCGSASATHHSGLVFLEPIGQHVVTFNVGGWSEFRPFPSCQVIQQPLPTIPPPLLPISYLFTSHLLLLFCPNEPPFLCPYCFCFFSVNWLFLPCLPDRCSISIVFACPCLVFLILFLSN